MKNTRVSPSDTIVELSDRCLKIKPSTYNTLRNRRSNSGSGFLGGKAEKKKKTAISKNFYIRECFRYVAIPEKHECGCGRVKAKHPADHVTARQKDAQWTPEKCTRRLPTDTYGEIEFDEDPASRKPYIRIEHETSATMLLRLMRRYWMLEVPNLVISVTGGAKDFQLQPRLREEFTKGLIKVASSTGAWIITGGTNMGVMKHVGEAVKSRGSAGKFGQTINVIGIASWGVINNNHSLISKNGDGCHPAYYNTDATKTGLDNNHSHFLLVDNGTTGQYATEIELRSRVEETIAKELKTESFSSTGCIGIPVVILCLEGGPGTVQTLLEAIKKGTPAVVIDGSGRAADVVSFAYKHLIYDDKRDICVIDPEFVDEIQEKVLDVFGEKNLEKVYSQIQEMLQYDKMVSIFRLEEGGKQNDMDLAILRALLKASKGSFQMKLKLALAWNRIDVAKSEIFTKELRMENFQVEWLYESMFAALLDDKHDFVELFLDEGINLKQFLTLDVLESLYNGIPQGSAVRQLIDKNIHLSKPDTPEIDMEVIGGVMEELMGDRFQSRYRSLDCYKPSIDRNGGRLSVDKLFATSEEDHDVATPYLDLFIWSILSNRHELSMLIWERTRDSVACALMASKILKSLAEKIVDNRELSYGHAADDLDQNANYYEQVAVGVLNECASENEHHAQTLLVKELVDFGSLTCLHIAVEAGHQDFIAQPSCQTLLTKLWMGDLYINTELWKVLICIFIPFLIPIIIQFGEDMEDNDEPATDSVPINSDTSFCQYMDAKILAHGSGSNSLNNSVVGSEQNLQKELVANEEVQHPNKTELEEDTHTILDHLDGGHDECVDIVLCDRHEHQKLGFFHRIIHFHEAPYVKFTINVFFYVILILIYCFVLLCALRIRPHPFEYVLQFWVLTLIFEEVRQLLCQESKTIYGKFIFYIADTWNINDALSMSLFLLATIFRYVATHKGLGRGDDYLIAARVMHSVSLVTFILRLLHIFSVDRNLGPKLVMIRKMLNDLGYFVVVLAVFIISYGVAKTAVLYPNLTIPNALLGVLNIPYWQMYGELFLDDIVEDKVNGSTGIRLCDQPGSEDTCSTSYGKHIAPVYMAVYMLFTNILLLNLLIAIFNNTFEKVQEDSDKVWKFQRYDLIAEYHERPPLCPPFIIFSHIYSIFQFIAVKAQCCGCKPQKGSSMKTSLSEEDEEKLSLWEFLRAECYVYKSSIKGAETQDNRLKTIITSLTSLTEEVDQIRMGESNEMYAFTSMPTTAMNRKESRPGTRAGRHHSVPNASNIENRLAKLEYNMEHVLELLIQQNQKQAAIMEASENIMKSSAGKPSADVLLVEHDVKSKVTNIHTKSRLSPYPGSTVQRAKIHDSQVEWQVRFADYQAVNYTSPSVLAAPYWADVDLMTLSPRPLLEFNEYDDANKVNRISHVARYEVVDRLPRNPYGRTGITGRGNLGRFGPNHAADPIATRWKRSSSGIVIDNGKRVLEFIAIQRKDNFQWAIPGGMVEPGEHVSETLQKEFTEEALAKLDMSEEKRKQVSERVAYLFRNGVVVYKGYVDDPRNTDNAWMETVACNFHDDSGEVFGEFQLQAGDDAQAVRWQRVSGNIPLFASHVGILEKVAKMHGAAFY